MGFVAKERDGEIARRYGSIVLPLRLRELKCPSCMTILMRHLCGLVLPVFWNTSCPEIRFLSVRIALLWSSHQCCIQDLAGHREITGVPQGRVKSVKQPFNGTRLCQTLTKQPDRFGIRHAVRQPQSQKAHERQAVVDQILCPFIRQIVQRLDDQNFEHQHRIKRRTSAFTSVRIGQSQLQIRAEHLKIHSPGKGLQLIAKPAQPSKALFNIKETRLLHLPPSPINAEEMESHRTAQRQRVFRTLHLVICVCILMPLRV
ncbi:Hypothetical protein APO_2757 [Acetobacter pomorum DM001]|uniref:Uncharacterized protein n=1 Tax=Acetobacter pomorum DM001 TaxID=945681 RepID=F1YWZ1_9PROT|nr:Hypothetical protein APO_2757 [Acetobacter pomorum DM001]